MSETEPDVITEPDPEPNTATAPAANPEPEPPEVTASAREPETNSTPDPLPPVSGTELPDGTAYVTPDGVIGVIGAYSYGERPLKAANIESLYAFTHAVRKESTYH